MEHVGATAQSHPDLLSLAQVAVVPALLLAVISQAIAMPASKQFAGAVQHRGPATAVSAVRIDGADEPRTLTTEVARRCRGWVMTYDNPRAAAELLRFELI